MGSYTEQFWRSDGLDQVPRRDRRSGPYRTYVPDALENRPLTVSTELTAKSAAAETAVRRVARGPNGAALEGIARFLLRSEAIASSLIEGIAPSPQQVALAELAQLENVRGFGDQARLVANNMMMLGRASREIAEMDHVDVRAVEMLHAALLPDDRHQGVRSVQNWIGDSSWHPLEAAFVPPAPDRVRELLADLVTYLNGAVHAPLIQAALVHAQFETIHPFTDGNGRVGRALIHTVLSRRGLTPRAVLPVSLVLGTLRDRYVAGLTSYRYDAAPAHPDAVDGVEAWLDTFLDAVLVAAAQTHQLTSEVADLRDDWDRQVQHARAAGGRRGTPRADSATARILALLTEVPVMTTSTAQRALGISFPAARSALEELADAGVMVRKSIERGTTGYLALDVLDLIGSTERRLGSTQFDTRASAPNRPVPVVPRTERHDHDVVNRT